jgi:hypothetical protein
MLATDGEIIADEMPKYPFTQIASRSTARSASRWRMSRCTYHDANTRYVVLFEHEKTILHAILTDRAPLLKRIIARLVGFDCAYPASSARSRSRTSGKNSMWGASTIVPSES